MKASLPKILILLFSSLLLLLFGFAQGEGGESRPNGIVPPKVKPPDFIPDRNSSGPVDWLKKLKEVEQQIRKQEELLADKNATIAAFDKQIEGKENELGDKKKSLADTISRLADCRNACETLRAGLNVKQVELAQKRTAVADLTTKLENLLRKIKVDEAEIDQLEKDFAETERKALIPHTTDWHYLDGKGWLWTSPEYYPLVFSEQVGGWLFYKLGTKKPWLYYDYHAETWVKWP